MNVPDNVWEKISELLDLGILLIPVAGAIGLIALVGVIAIFVTIIRREKEAKRIAEENDKKAKEFDREHQKIKEEIEAHRKRHFPDD